MKYPFSMYTVVNITETLYVVFPILFKIFLHSLQNPVWILCFQIISVWAIAIFPVLNGHLHMGSDSSTGQYDSRWYIPTPHSLAWIAEDYRRRKNGLPRQKCKKVYKCSFFCVHMCAFVFIYVHIMIYVKVLYTRQWIFGILDLLVC